MSETIKVLATLLAAAVLSSFVATVAFSQTNDIGKVLVVSNTLQLSADTERSSSSGPVVKKFIVPFAGKVRVRWQFKSAIVLVETGGFEDFCSGTNDSTTYLQRSCDVRVLEGDIIEVKAQGSGSIRNVRVYYDVVDNPGTIKKLN